MALQPLKRRDAKRSRKRAKRSPHMADRWAHLWKRTPESRYVKEGQTYDTTPPLCKCERPGAEEEGRCIKCGKHRPPAARKAIAKREQLAIRGHL